MPDPQTLAQYEQVLPGAAARIFERFERQAEHRIALERVVILGENGRANWGLAAAVSIALAGFITAGFLGFTGHEMPSSVIGGATLASLTWAFIRGTSVRRSERIEKAKLQARE